LEVEDFSRTLRALVGAKGTRLTRKPRAGLACQAQAALYSSRCQKSRKRPNKKAEDQQAEFVETERRLGVDMDEESFKRIIGGSVKDKPKTAK
jgi:hypothetical protein